MGMYAHIYDQEIKLSGRLAMAATQVRGVEYLDSVETFTKDEMADMLRIALPSHLEFDSANVILMRKLSFLILWVIDSDDRAITFA